ncbi:uncharacterized protein LOC128883430 [Hylaeus volcanicus]|uniref:uncharacterized protein LOC128883430 n=1 Tax=Hylaeus volcanicus TaxID=313075 RepID=UPI0023B78943|nr:uncharacterized protein LOC128883430 [Hylaeus volcanicus]
MYKRRQRSSRKSHFMNTQNNTENSPLDTQCLQSRFSMNLRVDHATFLAKIEQARQDKNLLLCVEENCQTPFGGPIKDPVAWVHLQKYLSFRGRGVEESSHHSTPSVKELLTSGHEALVRCQTPPPAKDLFIGFFENDQYSWSTHEASSTTLSEDEEFMDTYSRDDCTMGDTIQQDLHKSPPYKRENTLYRKDVSLISSQLLKEGCNQPCLKPKAEKEKSGLKKNAPRPCLTPLESVLDNPSKVEGSHVKPLLFQYCHGIMQPSRYTKEMTYYVVKLHEELENISKVQDARVRIRQRECQSPLLNIEQQDSQQQSQNIPHSFQHGLQICLENISLHTTSVEEESFLLRYAWYPRGLTLKDSMTLEFPLHHAWDIGKRGCVAKVTIVPENLTCECFNVKTRLRFLVLNGTNFKEFVTCYGLAKNSNTTRTNFKKTINVNDMRDASWNLPSRQVRVCVQNSETSSFLMIFHGLTLPFFSALLTLIRYIEASRHIQMINHRRIYLETFDREISYAKSLRNMLLQTKAMLWSHVEKKKKIF